MRRLLLLAMLLPMLLGDLPQLQGSGEVEAALTQEEREISGELALDGTYDAEAALSRLWGRFLAAAKEQLAGELRHVGVLLSAAILCALGEAFCADAGIREHLSLAVCAAAAVFFLGSSESLIQSASESLQRMKDYSAAAMPLLYTAAAASGAVSSSAGRYAAFCLASDVMMQLASDWILPLVRAYLALSLSNSLLGNAILESMGKICRWAAVTMMTAVTTLFCAYIGLTGLVTGSADAIAVKAARSVLSGALPVVGGILADSASAALSAASLICSSTGAFSMVAIAGICIGPVASLGIKLITYKGTAAAVETICGGRLSRLIASVGTTAAMLLGLLGSFACMLYFSIVSGLRALGVG